MNRSSSIVSLSSGSLLLALGLLTACTPTEKKTEPADPKTGGKQVAKKEQSDKAAFSLPGGTGPVAKVNGVDIERSPFNREYTQIMERYQRARRDIQPSMRERLKDNIVRRLIDAELIKQQAKKLEVSVSDKEAQTKWEEHKKRYGSNEAFKAFLERSKSSEQEVKRQFDANLMREKVFAKVAEDLKVDPKEVKDFYEKNKKRYDEPEQIRASHILVRLKPGAKENEKKDKRAQAEKILKLARKKGADFASLAKQYGEDNTKSRGGDLNFFSRGRMVKPFEDTAWKLKTGQVSGLVETQFGYHIIKKTDHKKAKSKTFSDVKAQIERSLQHRERNKLIRESLAKWKSESTIEIFLKGDPEILRQTQKPTPDEAKTALRKSPHLKQKSPNLPSTRPQTQ